MTLEGTIGRIGRQPKFQELVRRRSRFTWGLAILILAAYFALMSVVAFRPAWVRVPIFQGSVVTVGWPLAAGVIVVAWLLTGFYVRRANSEFEALKDEILAEARR